MDKNFVPNNGRFKILTKNGFSDFIGVTKSTSKFEMIEITIEQTKIITTTDHEIFINENDSKKAIDLKVGDYLFTNKGLLQISNISITFSNEVFDILHVEKENRFYISDKNNDILILVKNCIYLDELGFVPNAEEFYESVYPTISSSDTTKVIITSTPRGLNFFYKMWVDAERGRSEFIAYDVKWYEHPERDQKWYDTQIKNMNAKSIEQEIHCVGGNTKITFNGNVVKIKDLYSEYANKNSLNNNIVYFNE